MEWWGWISFIIIISYSGYPNRVRKLERQFKKLHRKLKGEKSMSKLLISLINQECMLKPEDGIWFNGNADLKCKILEVDKVIRSESIESIDFI